MANWIIFRVLVFSDLSVYLTIAAASLALLPVALSLSVLA